MLSPAGRILAGVTDVISTVGMTNNETKLLWVDCARRCGSIYRTFTHTTSFIPFAASSSYSSVILHFRDVDDTTVAGKAVTEPLEIMHWKIPSEAFIASVKAVSTNNSLSTPLCM